MQPTVCETIGQKLLESLARGGLIAAGGGAEVGSGVAIGREVKVNGFARLPVRRDLENCGATESAMSEEHFSLEGMVVGAGNHFGGDAGQLGVTVVVLAVEDEGNEGGSCGNDVVAELAGEVVAEGSGADFGNGKASGGDDKDGRAKFGGVRAQDEFGGALDFADAGIEEDLNFCGAAFGFEERSDVCGGAIAEKLAQSFFVVGDVVLFDEGEEIGRSEAGQSGFGEARIGRMEIFGSGVEIGEIAAASAGD